MVLKDRLKPKKQQIELSEPSKDDYLTLDEEQSVEFKVPIRQLTKKILSVKDNASLGAIVKEFAKFLDSLSDEKSNLSFKGDFDIGKKALITCLLANIIEDRDIEAEQPKESSEPASDSSKLIRKRRTLKEKLKNAKSSDI